MKRIHSFRQLLLVCLLLAASQQQNLTTFMVHAMQPADAIFQMAHPGANNVTVAFSNQEKERANAPTQGRKVGKNSGKRRLHKVPSGPNPIGNRHPPSHA
ncbi:hypothetical protein AMTRI_Chr08g162810 [Amborella trichopoda]